MSGSGPLRLILLGTLCVGCLAGIGVVIAGCSQGWLGSAAIDGANGDGANAGGETATNGDHASPGDSALPLFSFFVTSLAALQDLSASQDGFGGDLTFSETGPGAGLRGADQICAAIAERSMPGSSAKQWRAFLGVTDDGSGNPVNAIDRIGDGPWHDRVGRMLAPTRADLLFERPQNGDPTIRDDLPNEDGIPNHRPDPTQPEVDNHHMLTGSDENGELESSSATCQDWTTADGSSANGRPSCGFAWPRGGGGGGGGHWMTSYAAPGCAPGVDIGGGGGPPPGDDTVGGGGGYGGFYCFALVP
ncbi:hypothetical protein ACFL6C_00605 [Myxococcota bacterium]